jgi:hypothetical protein
MIAVQPIRGYNEPSNPRGFTTLCGVQKFREF